MESLARSVNESFPNIERKFVIIDACYAAAAAAYWLPQDGASPAEEMEDQVIARLGSAGTALLCAVSSADPALTPKDGKYTMFSSGLLHALHRRSIS
jgi:hypothetical protein